MIKRILKILLIVFVMGIFIEFIAATLRMEYELFVLVGIVVTCFLLFKAVRDKKIGNLVLWGLFVPFSLGLYLV